MIWIISKEEQDNRIETLFQVKSKYGPNLSSLKSRHKVGVKIDSERNLHLFVNNIDQGIAAEEIPHSVYGVVDVYGKCKQVNWLVLFTVKP